MMLLFENELDALYEKNKKPTHVWMTQLTR